MELEQRPPNLLTGPTSGSCRSRVADGKLETFDGFDVVGDHVRLGVDDRSNQVFLALEVRNQHRHEDARVAVFDLPDGPGEVGRTLVGEVVAVDAREDDVIEPDLGDGFPHVRGFVGVEWFHPPVSTSQKLPPREQRWPTSMNVAVPPASSPVAVAFGRGTAFGYVPTRWELKLVISSEGTTPHV